MFDIFALPRRKPGQVSLLEILLLTTATIALTMCIQARVVPTVVYTLGFLGGLLGSWFALSFRSCNLIALLVAGVVSGVAMGGVGIWVFETYFPWDSWISQAESMFSASKTAARLEVAFGRGGMGGLVATVLFTALEVCQDQVRQKKQMEAVAEGYTAA